MGPDEVFRDGPPQYPGEDTRLTSRKELSGWYAYGFAAEVFVICGMGECLELVLSSGRASFWSYKCHKLQGMDKSSNSWELGAFG
jgi:hypothetical protein